MQKLVWKAQKKGSVSECSDNDNLVHMDITPDLDDKHRTKTSLPKKKTKSLINPVISVLINFFITSSISEKKANSLNRSQSMIKLI